MQNKLFRLSLNHDKRYLRFRYDENQIDAPFWGLKLLTGEIIAKRPIKLSRDLSFGTKKSDLLPTNLHIYYIISSKLINAFMQSGVKGFNTYPLISEDNSFLSGEYVGISVSGRVKGRFNGVLKPLIIDSVINHDDIMLHEEQGAVSGFTIITEKVRNILNTFSIRNIEISDVITP